MGLSLGIGQAKAKTWAWIFGPAPRQGRAVGSWGLALLWCHCVRADNTRGLNGLPGSVQSGGRLARASKA